MRNVGDPENLKKMMPTFPGTFTRLVFPKTNKMHGAGCTSQHAGHSGLSPVRFF